jgi:hypothetical protein
LSSGFYICEKNIIIEKHIFFLQGILLNKKTIGGEENVYLFGKSKHDKIFRRRCAFARGAYYAFRIG